MKNEALIRITCWSSGTADPSASLGMTKGRVALPFGVMVVMTASWTSFILPLLAAGKSAARDDKGEGRSFHREQLPHRGLRWKHCLPLCHPERSRGICSSANYSWKRFTPYPPRSSNFTFMIGYCFQSL